jgi:hypothetical protein
MLLCCWAKITSGSQKTMVNPRGCSVSVKRGRCATRSISRASYNRELHWSRAGARFTDLWRTNCGN